MFSKGVKNVLKNTYPGTQGRVRKEEINFTAWIWTSLEKV